MRILVLFATAFCLTIPLGLDAAEEGNSTSSALVLALKQGRISADLRYRFETFEREGAPFTGDAYAPTLRIALGYETRSYHGFSAFAQGLALLVTGPADYSIPTLPSQNRPDRPTINDPRTVQLAQGYLKWTGVVEQRKMIVKVGRQEIALNDGRFVSVSYWRQVHETLDAARFDTDITRHATFTYAYVNRTYRTIGHDATDGKPPMHSHLLNLAAQKTGRVNVSLYGVLLDYRSAAQYALSTRTFGVRATGPYDFNPQWSLRYAAEFANQRNFGSNPNYVNANYYLGEFGPAWRGWGLEGGYALLGGRSSTNELTTPLANPFNGWTELFANNPNLGNSHGLEARYVIATGTVKSLGGATAVITYYDYHSDSNRIHYGSELDWGLAYKIKPMGKHWEVGNRFGYYWADRLFTRALRAALYVQFTL